jgi:hypothetical protein
MKETVDVTKRDAEDPEKWQPKDKPEKISPCEQRTKSDVRSIKKIEDAPDGPSD